MSPKAEKDQGATVEAIPVIDATPVKDARSDAGTEASAEDPVGFEIQSQADYCFDFAALCCGIGTKGTCPECQQGVAFSDYEAVAVGVADTKYYHSSCYEEHERKKIVELQNKKVVAIQAIARGKIARAKLASKEEEEPVMEEADDVSPEREDAEAETKSQASEQQAIAEDEDKAEEHAKADEEAKVEEEAKADEEALAVVEEAPVAEKSVEDDVDTFPEAPSKSVEAEADEDGSVEIQAVDDDGSVEIKEVKSTECGKQEAAGVNTDNLVESSPAVEQGAATTEATPKDTTAPAKPQKKSFVAKLRRAFGCKAADSHVVTN